MSLQTATNVLSDTQNQKGKEWKHIIIESNKTTKRDSKSGKMIEEATKQPTTINKNSNNNLYIDTYFKYKWIKLFNQKTEWLNG